MPALRVSSVTRLIMTTDRSLAGCGLDCPVGRAQDRRRST
jgi:hypothetical protein